ncbi:MAG: mechanosensitive ion channel family protein [Gemmatimonadota bacterium]
MTGPTAALASAIQATDNLDQVRDRASELADLISLADVAWIVVILVATAFLIRVLRLVMGAVSRRLPRQRPLILQLVAALRVALWLGAACIIISGIIDPPPETLIALWATLGVGVGLAAQDVLKNIFGGLVILLDRPFQVGDLIDIGSHHGEVIHIGLRATQLRTRDDTVVSVPNAEVVRQPVLNANSGALDCMVVTELKVPVFADPLLLRRIGREAAITSPFVYTRKPITVQTASEISGNRFNTRVTIRAYVYDHRLEIDFQADVAARARRALLDAGLVGEDDLPGLERTADIELGAGAPA